MELIKQNYRNQLTLVYCMGVVILGILLLLIGNDLNFQAIKSNDCKMPVLSTIDMESDTHIWVSDYNKINNIHLVDIYPIRGWVYSIGDFFIYGGRYLTIYGLIILLFFGYKAIKINKLMRLEWEKINETRKRNE